MDELSFAAQERLPLAVFLRLPTCCSWSALVYVYVQICTHNPPAFTKYMFKQQSPVAIILTLVKHSIVFSADIGFLPSLIQFTNYSPLQLPQTCSDMVCLLAPATTRTDFCGRYKVYRPRHYIHTWLGTPSQFGRNPGCPWRPTRFTSPRASDWLYLARFGPNPQR